MNAPHRLALLGLVAGFVSLVAPSAPAGAAPVPCVQTIAGSGADIAPDADGDGLTTTPVTLDAPAAAGAVEDVDVTVSLEHPNAFQVRVRLAHAGTPDILQRRVSDSGEQVLPLTWDDESSDGLRTRLTGGHLPTRPAARRARRHHAVRRVAAARRQLGQGRRSAAVVVGAHHVHGVRRRRRRRRGPHRQLRPRGQPGPVRHRSRRRRRRVRRRPRRGRRTALADNCPQDANATQVNSDTDALGDACDADDDDDARADASDGCRLESAATSSGCPPSPPGSAWRKEKSRLVGRVRSDRAACLAGVRVTLKRARPGANQNLVVTTTARRPLPHARPEEPAATTSSSARGTPSAWPSAAAAGRPRCGSAADGHAGPGCTASCAYLREVELRVTSE